MKKLLLTPATTVEKALEDSMQASRLFIEYHTACNGCPLKRFCTLQEMAQIYAIDLPPFLEALQQFHNKTV
jgi:Fe-S cluster biogenesis protein NfuA